MHEVSLVRSIFSTLEQEFDQEELSRLSVVRLKVGAMSNVEPILMQNAFDAVVQDRQEYKDVSLDMEKVPVKIQCEDCGAITEVENYKFVCICGKPSSNVISGTELLITQVEFLEPVS